MRMPFFRAIQRSRKPSSRLLGTDRGRFLIERRQKIAHGAVERRGREISQLGDGVGHCSNITISELSS